MSSVWIFPSSMTPCVIKGRLTDGSMQMKLCDETESNELDVRLSFTHKYCGEQTEMIVIKCDRAKANDGGTPYLLVYDVLQISHLDLSDVSFGIRYELAGLLLSDTEFYNANKQDDFRLFVPPMFHVQEIADVYDYTIPSFCADVCGVRLCNPIRKNTFVYRSLLDDRNSQ
jgi:hypothetical protein